MFIFDQNKSGERVSKLLSLIEKNKNRQFSAYMSRERKTFAKIFNLQKDFVLSVKGTSDSARGVKWQSYMYWWTSLFIIVQNILVPHYKFCAYILLM